jgi:hypothetical protein
MRAAAAIAALAGLALPAVAQGQPLGEDDVMAALDTAEKREAFASCTAGHSLPEIVTLEILVREDGSMSLVTTSPEVDPTALGCIAGVVASSSTRPLPGTYQIGFPVQTGAYGEPAPAPAAPAAVTVEGAPPAQPAAAGQEGDWRIEYEKGRRLLGAGIALTVLGGGTAVGTAVYSVFSILFCFMSWGGTGCTVARHPGVVVAVALSGLAVMGVGIGLLVSGIVRKRRASRTKRALGLGYLGPAPAPDGQGGLALAVLAF